MLAFYAAARIASVLVIPARSNIPSVGHDALWKRCPRPWDTFSDCKAKNLVNPVLVPFSGVEFRSAVHTFEPRIYCKCEIWHSGPGAAIRACIRRTRHNFTLTQVRAKKSRTAKGCPGHHVPFGLAGLDRTIRKIVVTGGLFSRVRWADEPDDARGRTVAHKPDISGPLFDSRNFVRWNVPKDVIDKAAISVDRFTLA